jgi:cyanate permease
MVEFIRKDLVNYLGSRHSTVGLLLVWFGLPALFVGIWFLTAPEIARWLSISLTTWSVLALISGVAMRSTSPPPMLKVLAYILYGLAVLAFCALLLWKTTNG